MRGLPRAFAVVRWRLFDANSTLIDERGRGLAKTLIYLALPRGIEPLFQP